jgi:hypothetical protein
LCIAETSSNNRGTPRMKNASEERGNTKIHTLSPQCNSSTTEEFHCFIQGQRADTMQMRYLLEMMTVAPHIHVSIVHFAFLKCNFLLKSVSRMQYSNMHRSVKWIVCLPLSISNHTLQNRYLYLAPSSTFLPYSFVRARALLHSSPPPLWSPLLALVVGANTGEGRGRGRAQQAAVVAARKQTGKGAGRGGSRRRWSAAWGARPRR